MRRGSSRSVLPALMIGLASGLSAVSCNHSSGSGSNSVQTGTLSGTVSNGAPIANATLVLKDWNGAVLSTTTDASGRYTFTVKPLTPPFLLWVDDGAGAKYYGVAFDAGRSNVTLFSDRIVNDLCKALDVPPADLFDDPAASPAPSREGVRLLERLYRDQIALWLRREGIDPEKFDLLASPFAADGRGFSAVLAMTEFTGGSIVIDDGTMTQTTMPVGGPPAWWQMTTTLVAPGGTSVRNVESYYPATGAGVFEGVLRGVNDLLAAVKATANARGGALTSDDLLPYVSVDCADDGMDRATFAAQIAGFLRQVHVDDLRITRVDDWTEEWLDGEFEIVTTLAGHVIREIAHEQFMIAGPAEPFQFFGTHRWAKLSASCERVTHAYVAGPPDEFLSIAADVRAPSGLLSAVTVTSDDPAPIFDGTVAGYRGSDVERLAPTPSTTLDWHVDLYDVAAKVASLPPADTSIAFTMTKPGGAGTQTATIPLRGGTSEPLALQSPTGHALADASLGGRLAVTWKLPVTFTVQSIELSGECWDFNQQYRSSMGSDEQIDPTDTVAHLTFPADLLGTPIGGASFRLAIQGKDGESSVVNWFFGDPY